MMMMLMMIVLVAAVVVAIIVAVLFDFESILQIITKTPALLMLPVSF
jgi:hypothetical protein